MIEVCLAFCRQTGPATNRDIAERRNMFRNYVASFNSSLTKVVRFICSCGNGYPTSSCLPNPTDFARLLVFVWSGFNSHDETYRKYSLVKADVEKKRLMTRIGARNWLDDPDR